MEIGAKNHSKSHAIESTADHTTALTASQIVQVNSGQTALESTTTPRTTELHDTSGNEVLETPATASAVNHAKLTNAAAGGAGTETVTLEAVGSDTNVHLSVNAKGSAFTGFSILRQDDTSNTYSGDNVVLAGWGFKQGVAAVDMQDAVTFGVTFSTQPIVLLGKAGVLNGSDPTDAGDFTSNDVSTVIHQKIVTTTGFTVEIADIDAASNLNTAFRYGYTWIAIGSLA